MPQFIKDGPGSNSPPTRPAGIRDHLRESRESVGLAAVRAGCLRALQPEQLCQDWEVHGAHHGLAVIANQLHSLAFNVGGDATRISLPPRLREAQSAAQRGESFRWMI
jgi:hypothetical protein